MVTTLGACKILLDESLGNHLYLSLTAVTSSPLAGMSLLIRKLYTCRL